MYVGLHVMCLLRPILAKNCNLLTGFIKNPKYQNFTNIHPVGYALFYADSPDNVMLI
jgi:hypothetical protein